MRAAAVTIGITLVVLGAPGCESGRQPASLDDTGQASDQISGEKTDHEERQNQCRQAIDRLQAPFQRDVTYIPRAGFHQHEDLDRETIESHWDDVKLVDEGAGPNGELYEYCAAITLAGKTGAAASVTETTYGTFVVELTGLYAPDLVRHFLALARSGFYQGKPMQRHPRAAELPFLGTAFADDPYVFKTQRNVSPPPLPGRHVPIPRGSLLALHENTAETESPGQLLATKLFLNPYDDIDQDWRMQTRPVIFGIANEVDADIMARLARGMDDANTTVFIKEINITRAAQTLRSSSMGCPPELLRGAATADAK